MITNKRKELQNLFIIFILFSILGTYYEEIRWYIVHGVWSKRVGLIYGPFSPIYGIGAVVFASILNKDNDKRSILKTFLYSALIGGLVEYLVSFGAEFFFDLDFWNYGKKFLNINGRTTIPYMAFWGILGTFYMKIIYPLIIKIINKIPKKITNIAFKILLVFIIIDFTLTLSAMGRMVLREKNIKPYTIYGKFLDKLYPDEFMHERFPVMRKSGTIINK